MWCSTTIHTWANSVSNFHSTILCKNSNCSQAKAAHSSSLLSHWIKLKMQFASLILKMMTPIGWRSLQQSLRRNTSSSQQHGLRRMSIRATTWTKRPSTSTGATSSSLTRCRKVTWAVRRSTPRCGPNVSCMNTPTRNCCRSMSPLCLSWTGTNSIWGHLCC